MIRLAREGDLPRILEIYATARAFMRANGNPNQWKDGYPAKETLLGDIAAEKLYVGEENGIPFGVFFLSEGPDPTYSRIDGEGWRSGTSYGVIHRIAVDGSGRGVAAECFAFAAQHCENIRIDTHEKNIPMQRCLTKNGFTRCGIIYLEDGDPRIAYQKVI